MMSHSINLESPNVKSDDTGQLTYEEIVEQIQEKIQVKTMLGSFVCIALLLL